MRHDLTFTIWLSFIGLVSNNEISRYLFFIPGFPVSIYDSRLNPIDHHHQPINDPTAGTQAFFMDYTQVERAITHAGLLQIGGC
jgi:hypothetical protein